jgi:FkbM family methyltransferase
MLAEGLKRHLGPSLFYPARRAYVLWRYLAGVPYDRDLYFVRRLRPGCLLLDIGANAGQSALAMAALRPDARIVSFEANRHNIADLRLVARLLRGRHSFHHVALSDREDRGVLRMPLVGGTPMPALASLEPAPQLGPVDRVEEQEVLLRTLDSFELRPDFVKLDVEGHEHAVLRGMERTLGDCGPALMIERSGSFPRLRPYLAALGYAPFTYRPETDELVPTEAPTTFNFFALPAP